MSPEHSQLVLSFIVLLIIAAVTAYYAERKGRNSSLWFVLGVLLGIFAPLILFFLPSLKETDQDGSEPTMTLSRPDPSLQNLPHQLSSKSLEWREEENKLWYYLDNEHQQMGPVSIIALKDLWKRGLLELNSYVWSEGMGQWQKVDDLPQLKSVLNG